MGRRAFENRSRKQNQREIMRERKRFLGENSDLPANEIDRAHQVEVLNAALYDNYAKARPGLQGTDTMLFGASGAEDVISLTNTSQSGTTFVSPDRAFVTTDVGKLLCFDPILSSATYRIVRILSVTVGGYTCTVNASQTVAAGVAVVMRSEVYGFARSPLSDCWFAHIGHKLYKKSDTAFSSWEEVYPVGSALPAQNSTIDFLDDKVVIFADGVYVVNLTSKYYFKSNNSNGALAMTAGSESVVNDYSYNRRYLITKLRLPGVSAFASRATIAIDHETGSSNVLSGSDYVEIGSTNATGIPNANVLRFYPTWSYFTSSVGTKFSFAIAVNGTAYQISVICTFPGGYSTTTVETLITAINDAVFAIPALSSLYDKTTAKRPFYYPTNVLSYVDMMFNTSVTVGYLSTGTTPATYTDISGSGKLNGATGSPQVYLFGEEQTPGNVVHNVGFSGNQDPYTHYSIYGTPDYQVSTGIGLENRNNFTWLDDVVIMKAFSLTGSNAISELTATLTATKGQFVEADLYRKIRLYVTDGTAAKDKYYYEAVVTAFTSSTQVTVTSTTPMWEQNNMVIVGIIGGTTIVSGDTLATASSFTVGTVYNLAGLTHATHYATLTPLTLPWVAGSLLFLSTGDIVPVTAVTTPTSVYKLLAPAASNSVYAADAAVVDSYYDRYTDNDLSARIGTLAIRTRFMQGVPNTSIGKIVDGFMFTAVGQNYYWSSLANGYRYLISNYNPNHQTDKYEAAITGFGRLPDMVNIFSAYSTAQIPTNLDGNINIDGTVVFTLPTYSRVSSTLGIKSSREICQLDTGSLVVINQDDSIRQFNGYSYSKEPLTLNSIELKLAALSNRMLTFDPQIGLIIIGSTIADSAYNNKFYIYGLGNKMPSGAAEWTECPMNDVNVPPVIHDAKLVLFHGGYWFKPGEIATREDPAMRLVRFEHSYEQDTRSGGCGNYNIAWSLIESDDTGEVQSYTIDHLESHASLSPQVETLGFPVGLTVICQFYNDIGVYTDTVLDVSTDSDIVAVSRISGHRIRKAWSFDRGGVYLNDTLSYYKVNDKVNYRINPNHTLGLKLANIIAGYTRYENAINTGTGLSLNAYDLNGQPSVAMSAQVLTSAARIAGPDGSAAGGFYGLFAANLRVQDNWAKLGTVYQDDWSKGAVVYQDNYGPGDAGFIHAEIVKSVTDFSFMIWCIPPSAGELICNFGAYDEGVYPQSSYMRISISALAGVQLRNWLGFANWDTTLLSTSAWGHLAFVYSSGNVTLYYNGVLVSSVALNLDGYISTDMFISGTDKTFDVRLIDTALAAADIAAYYYDVVNNNGNKYLPIV